MEVICVDTKVTTVCSKCKEELTYFKAYIPDLGEVCMKCYTEYAQELERQAK